MPLTMRINAEKNESSSYIEPLKKLQRNKKNKKDKKVYNKWLFMILLVPLYGYMILRQKLPEDGFIDLLIPDLFCV